MLNKSSLVHLEFREASCKKRESLRTLPPTPTGCHSIWFSLAWFTLVPCVNLWLTHFVHIVTSPLKLSRCPLQRSHSLQGVESGVTSEACLANGYRAMANMMCKKSYRTIHFLRFWINPSVSCLLSFHLRETQTDLAPNCLSLWRFWENWCKHSSFQKKTCNTMLIFDPPTFLLIRFFFVNMAVLLKGTLQFNAIFSTLSFCWPLFWKTLFILTLFFKSLCVLKLFFSSELSSLYCKTTFCLSYDSSFYSKRGRFWPATSPTNGWLSQRLICKAMKCTCKAKHWNPQKGKETQSRTKQRITKEWNAMQCRGKQCKQKQKATKPKQNKTSQSISKESKAIKLQCTESNPPGD